VITHGEDVPGEDEPSEFVDFVARAHSSVSFGLFRSLPFVMRFDGRRLVVAVADKGESIVTCDLVVTK